MKQGKSTLCWCSAACFQLRTGLVCIDSTKASKANRRCRKAIHWILLVAFLQPVHLRQAGVPTKKLLDLTACCFQTVQAIRSICSTNTATRIFRKLMETHGTSIRMSMNVAYQEDSRGIPGIHLVLSLCFAAILHHCLAFRALSPVALHPNLFRVCLQSSLIWFAIWRATVPIYSKHLKTTQSQDLPAGCNKQFARNKHWQLPPKPENSIQDTKTRILTTENKNDHIGPNESTSQADVQYLPVCPTNSPQSWFLWRPVPRYSKRIQKIQKDSKHFEAFRVAFEPSLIPKSFFGWRNLHRSGSMPHLWTQDETWIVRKSAQPPSQRLRAKANKRRRKGPVTTFQANTPNHAVSNFQTVERQLIKIVEKGGQRSTGSKWSITETHRSASSAWQSNWVSMREASFRALHCSSRIMSSYFDSSM